MPALKLAQLFSTSNLLVGRPLLVHLFREVTCVAYDRCLQGFRVERELDTQLGVKVDEGVDGTALLRLD